MNSNAILLLLCGLPGSGKTYLSNLLRQKAVNGTLFPETTKTECCVICFDKLMPVEFEPVPNKLNNIKSISEWKESRKTIRILVENLVAQVKGYPEIPYDPKKCTTEIEEFREKLKNGDLSEAKVIFLIDDNMHLKSMRFEYFQLARKYGIGFCQIYVECDLPVALHRNKSRSGSARVPSEVIQAMAEKIEAPQPLLHSWEKFSLVLKGNCDHLGSNWNSLENLLMEAIDNPVPPLEDHSEIERLSRERCLKNVLHQADQILRKLLSEAIRDSTSNEHNHDLKQLSLKLNATRKVVLADIKLRTIVIPEEIFSEVDSGNVANIAPKFKAFLKEEMDKRL